MMKKILCTCPPMIKGIDALRGHFAEIGAEVFCPKFIQVVAEHDLIEMIPEFDGWIIGDDPATASVFQAGRSGKLKAVVKWGIGMDNVDRDGAESAGFHVPNTPGMFSEEVSDVAVGYLIGVARDLFLIDRDVREGKWNKPPGTTLFGKTVALVGFGNIGQAVARKLLAFGMKVVIYDPAYAENSLLNVARAFWPERLDEANFVILTCALSPSSLHIVNAESLQAMMQGVSIINVGRGSLIDERALIDALQSGHVSAVALDVFEEEPLPSGNPLRVFDRCIFGTHNSSNTKEAVYRASVEAIQLIDSQFMEK